MQQIIPLSPNRLRRVQAHGGRLLDRWTREWERQVGRRVSTFGARVDHLPSWAWPLLVALATWPSIGWALRRLFDDSDDPLGIVASIALMLALWQSRGRFETRPRVGLLCGAAALAIVANLPAVPLADLARALLSSAALVCALAAIGDRDEPIAPYAGLAVLALPLLSSLQFYAGFPLRVVTAEATRWLLSMTGSVAERTGSALTVDGRLILVDAPCSGVRMVWVGYFTACAVAWLCRTSNRGFVARLPAVGATVLAGNIVRNTLLVAADARAIAMTDAMHAAVGLLAFASVSVVIAFVFAGARRVDDAKVGAARHPVFVLPSSAPAACVAALSVAALLPFARPPASTVSAASAAIEWPVRYDDRPMRPLALSPLELRFATQFPGTVARFANGERTVVLRDVQQPTRRLHPAVDCYRGLGYAIDGERLERDGQARLWRCFDATGARGAVRVCERIVDADGGAFTDVSSWYWAATWSRSHGPWRAYTVATPLAGEAS